MTRWTWVAIAVFGILLSYCVILKLHESGIYPIREATKIIRRPWFETTLLLFIVGGLIQYGATKGTNGTAGVNRPSLMQRSDLQLDDADGFEGALEESFAITNLCFTRIAPLSNSVCLSVAWPTNTFVEGTTLDFFAKVNALTNLWTWLEAHDTVPFATNLEVEIARPILAPSTNVPAAMFFRVQDRNTCATTMRDADQDGIPDVYELHNGTNPYVPDSESAPRLTVGRNGDYASVEAALADSTAYSVISLGGETFMQSAPVVMPSHPVLIEGPKSGYAVIRSDAEVGAVKLTDGQDAQTMFRNLIVDLRARKSFQAGFWVGGGTPWTGRGAAATFENVRVRANYPGVEHYGWLFYRDGGCSSILRKCVMNAAGSTWAYGVSSFNAASNVIEDCAFLNLPTNSLEESAIAVMSRESTNVVVEIRPPEARPDLSWAGYPYAGSYSQTADADGDGISDYDEIFRTNTDPWLADSDGDEISDGVECNDGTDPRNLNSHDYLLVVSVTNADMLVDVTNYVFVGTGGSQWGDMVYSCHDEGGSTNFTWKISNGALLVSSFRDLNRNGIFDSDYDVVLSNRVSGLHAAVNLAFHFGDVDGDGISDTQELTDGSDPYDANQFCFNLTLAEQGIFHTTNSLLGEICIGNRTICGPSPLLGRQWETDVGHVVVSNRDQLAAYFWDDVNANGVRDADEICITQQVKIVGHENCLTNALEMGGFDVDQDGMLDYWEDLHKDAGLSPTNAADAFLDADADGLINLHEYWANCNPAIPDGSNTVLSVMARSIDDLLTNDATGRCSKFANYGTVLNTNCWAYAVDTSCASPANSWYGAFKAGTAVTSRHVIQAAHYCLRPGDRISFLDTNGVSCSRMIVGTNRVENSDIFVCLLDENLPDSVRPAKILPKNYFSYIHTARGLPGLMFDFSEHAILSEFDDFPDSHGSVDGRVPTNSLRRKYFEEVESGDSGNPKFLLVHNEAILVCTLHTYGKGKSGAGPFLTSWANELQSVMDGLSDEHSTPRMNLEYFDFSNYEKLWNE